MKKLILYAVAIIAGNLYGQTSWLTTGNALTNPLLTEFLGTTTSYPLVFKTSNFPRMAIDAGGNVGIANLNPAAMLHLGGSYGQLYTGNNQGFLIKFASGDKALMELHTPDGVSENKLIIQSSPNGSHIWSGSGKDLYLQNGGGLVSIGTIGSNAPQASLHLGGGNGQLYQGTQGFLMKFTSGDRAIMELHTPDGVPSNRLIIQSHSSGSHIWSGDGRSLYLQNGGGNVGIGVTTNNAQGKLHIVTEAAANTGILLDHNCIEPHSYGVLINVKNDLTKALAIQNTSGSTATTLFQVFGNGVVNAKSVYAEAVTVTPTAIGITWPDYVFNKDYKLMSLKDLEAFITTNKHLPNVPSVNEVKQNGVNLYEINRSLLEKVEELSLYVIELKKEIDQLKK